ncbi:hypothetical protein G6F31_017977 [Rhizopus arrhizus]|nr:hypothetical protein G6F31_017977 [Rhizopus arrhizus]
MFDSSGDLHMTIRKALSRHPLSFALTTALLATGIAPAFAQEAGNEAGGKNATNLDRVSVVGSRIKRSDVEGPAPVTVITRTDIDREEHHVVLHRRPGRYRLHPQCPGGQPAQPGPRLHADPGQRPPPGAVPAAVQPRQQRRQHQLDPEQHRRARGSADRWCIGHLRLRRRGGRGQHRAA